MAKVQKLTWNIHTVKAQIISLLGSASAVLDDVGFLNRKGSLNQTK